MTRAELEAEAATLRAGPRRASEQRRLDYLEGVLEILEDVDGVEEVRALMHTHLERESPRDYATTTFEGAPPWRLSNNE